MPSRYEQEHRFRDRTVTYLAFQAELDPKGQRKTKDADCGISRWNMILPGQHLLWERYSLMTCHLREVPGVPSPHIHVPGATHEVTLFAIDPDFPM